MFYSIKFFKKQNISWQRKEFYEKSHMYVHISKTHKRITNCHIQVHFDAKRLANSQTCFILTYIKRKLKQFYFFFSENIGHFGNLYVESLIPVKPICCLFYEFLKIRKHITNKIIYAHIILKYKLHISEHRVTFESYLIMYPEN